MASFSILSEIQRKMTKNDKQKKTETDLRLSEETSVTIFTYFKLILTSRLADTTNTTKAFSRSLHEVAAPVGFDRGRENESGHRAIVSLSVLICSQLHVPRGKAEIGLVCARRQKQAHSVLPSHKCSSSALSLSLSLSLLSLIHI